MEFIDYMIEKVDLEFIKRDETMYEYFCEKLFSKIFEEIEKNKLDGIEVMEYVGKKLT